MPRAVHLDHEIMRLLQSLGLAEELAGEMLPVREYRWFGADGDPLLTMSSPAPASSGWEPDYMFFQPALEARARRPGASTGAASPSSGAGPPRSSPTAADGVELTV